MRRLSYFSHVSVTVGSVCVSPSWPVMRRRRTSSLSHGKRFAWDVMLWWASRMGLRKVLAHHLGFLNSNFIVMMSIRFSTNQLPIFSKCDVVNSKFEVYLLNSKYLRRKAAPEAWFLATRRTDFMSESLWMPIIISSLYGTSWFTSSKAFIPMIFIIHVKRTRVGMTSRIQYQHESHSFEQQKLRFHISIGRLRWLVLKIHFHE